MAIQAKGDDSAGNRIWTIPNLLSVLRLLGVPLFLWLVLVPQADWWALAVLAFAGLSDWLDGKIARAWNQTSRIGMLLDPLADRLYIFAALLGLLVRDMIPWWLMALLVLRDALIALALPILRHYGYGPLPVNFAGKVATTCLLYSFPLLFLAGYGGIVGNVAQVVGWAFAIWGTAIYWWAGLLYAVQGLRLIRQSRHADRTTAASSSSVRRSAATAEDPTALDKDRVGKDPQGRRTGRSGPTSSDRKGATSPP
ncbi:CDP-alcohol phosphatidyltransferase family protein [Salinactinospora qingdaonensis]|uniref:Cardiolipin synthase n=1 Tax=Salinactinospora qingdaonensis TaxID=702744 RepID=A0ABP7FJI9_9ACTN